MNLGSVRDLSIIILALESLVVGVLLSILIVQVTRLIRMLRDEVMPILYSTQETLGTVRGTTTFRQRSCGATGCQGLKLHGRRAASRAVCFLAAAMGAVKRQGGYQ